MRLIRHLLSPLLVFALISLLAFVAFGQDAEGSAAAVSPVAWVLAHWMELVLATLALIEFAKRVAALTPSKRDDEITSQIERLARKGVDLIAGKTGSPLDVSAIRRTES